MISSLPDSDPLKPVCEVLQRAFPSGLPEPLYLSLLRVLSDQMSFRAVSRAVEVAFGTERIRVLHAVFGVQSMDVPDPKDVEIVRQKLREAGFEDLPEE